MTDFFKHCKIFDNYQEKEYKIIITDNLFGDAEYYGTISDFIEDGERVGIKLHHNEIYCELANSEFGFEHDDNAVYFWDNEIKITIILQNE